MHRAGFSAIVGTGACCGRQSGRRRDPQRSRNRQKYAGLERQPRAGQSRSVHSYPAHAIRAYHLSPQQGSGSGSVTQCAAVSGAAREHTIMVARHDRPDICWSVRCSPWDFAIFGRCPRFAHRMHRTSVSRAAIVVADEPAHGGSTRQLRTSFTASTPREYRIQLDRRRDRPFVLLHQLRTSLIGVSPV